MCFHGEDVGGMRDESYCAEKKNVVKRVELVPPLEIVILPQL